MNECIKLLIKLVERLERNQKGALLLIVLLLVAGGQWQSIG